MSEESSVEVEAILSSVLDDLKPIDLPGAPASNTGDYPLSPTQMGNKIRAVDTQMLALYGKTFADLLEECLVWDLWERHQERVSKIEAIAGSVLSAEKSRFHSESPLSFARYGYGEPPHPPTAAVEKLFGAVPGLLDSVEGQTYLSIAYAIDSLDRAMRNHQEELMSAATGMPMTFDGPQADSAISGVNYGQNQNAPVAPKGKKKAASRPTEIDSDSDGREPAMNRKRIRAIAKQWRDKLIYALAMQDAKAAAKSHEVNPSTFPFTLAISR